MGARVQQLATRGAQDLRTRWPLEDMLGADLVGFQSRDAFFQVAYPLLH